MEEIVTAVGRGPRRRSDPAQGGPRRTRRPCNEVLANTIIYFTLPEPRRLAPRLGRRHRQGPGRLLPALQRQRDRPEPRLAGHRLHVPRPTAAAPSPRRAPSRPSTARSRTRGGQFAAGDDLHGQPFADALSYTLMPHGRHRHRQGLPHPRGVEADQPRAVRGDEVVAADPGQRPAAANCIPEDAQALGAACDQIYAQTWGSVYDTINYTTTGTLGDWFDSHIGLGADGIDNEMSFSHLDRNIAFEPQGEQLHVAGNKAIIYSHIADLLRPPGTAYSTPGRTATCRTTGSRARRSSIQPGRPPGTSAAGGHRRRGPRSRERARTARVYGFDGRAATPTPTTAACASTSARRTSRESAPASRRCRSSAGAATTTSASRTPTSGSRSPRTTTSRSLLRAGRPDGRGQPTRAAKPDGEPVEWRAVVERAGRRPALQRRLHVGPGHERRRHRGRRAAVPGRLRRGEHGLLHGPERATRYADNDKFDAVDPREGDRRASSRSTRSRRSCSPTRPCPATPARTRARTRPTGGRRRPTSSSRTTKPTTPGPGGRTACSQTRREHRAQAVHDRRRTTATGQSRSGSSGRSRRATTTSSSTPTRTATASGDADDPEATSSAGFIDDIGGDQRPAAAGRATYVIVVVNCAAPPEPTRGRARSTFQAEFPPAGQHLGDRRAEGRLDGEAHATGSRAAATSCSPTAALRALPELTSDPGRGDHASSVVYVGQTSFQVCDDVRTPTDRHRRDATRRRRSTIRSRRTSPSSARASTRACGARRSSRRRSASRSRTAGGSDASFARQFDVDQTEFTAAGGRAAGGSVDAGARDAAARPDAHDRSARSPSARARSASSARCCRSRASSTTTRSGSSRTRSPTRATSCSATSSTASTSARRGRRCRTSRPRPARCRSASARS